jgi:polar amino acid transport system substrate-binding protein
MAMSSITIVPQRNAEVAFIGPYFVSGKAFLTREKRIAEATSLKKLDTPDVHLTALKGSTSQAFVEDGLSHAGLVLSDSYDEAVRMVLENKVHAMVADYPICAVSVLRYPGEGLLTEIMPLTYEPLGIALPPDDPHLLNWVENTLNILKGNGTLKAIEDRWFKDVSWLSRLP